MADSKVDTTDDRTYDEPELYPLLPGVDTTIPEFKNRFVEYNVRGPNDGIRRGPVAGKGWGPGRWYRSRKAAYEAMCRVYGRDRVKQIPGFQIGRWAFLIKDLTTKGKLEEE